MTRHLTVEHVITIHDAIQPDGPLRDRSALAGAVGQPSATWGGRQLYLTLLEQSAVLLNGLVRAHAFVDGNKRTAWISTQVLLRVNRSPIYDVPAEQAADFVESIAVDHPSLPEVTAWLRDRLLISGRPLPG